MGQAASKAAAEAAKAAVKRRPPSSSSTTDISKSIQQPVRASASDSGGGTGGFYPGSSTRAQQHQSDTARRIANAASSRSDDVHSNNDDAHSNLLDLPPDLLKFLNDAGPVKRTIDKQLTSARVYDAIVQDETVAIEHARQANTRVRRRMPILSSSSRSPDATRGDGLVEENDGTMTERTTNFSNRTSSSNSVSSPFNNYLGVTRQDFFDLSIKLQGVTVDSPEWKKLVHDKYESIAITSHRSKAKNTTTETTKGGFDNLRDMALLENCARYIGVPTLMKDTEGDIIGMWQYKVEDMKHSLGLKAVRMNSLQFVLQNEDVGGGDAKES